MKIATDTDWTVLRLNSLLEEYKTLRMESLQGISARIQIVTFTFGALSIIIGALLNAPDHPIVTGFVAILAVPQLSKAALLMWLGEYRRSARAGKAVRRIEIEINRLLGDNVLTWEGSLSNRSDHMAYPYVATILVVLFSSYASIAIGIMALAEFAYANPVANLSLFGGQFPDVAMSPVAAATVVSIILLLIAVAAELGFWLWVQKLWREARSGIV